MSASDNNNKTTRRDRLRVLRNGIQLHLLPVGQITIGGNVVKVQSILDDIDADVARSDAAEKGHAAWLGQVADERASHKALDPILSGVRQWVRLNIGDTEAQQATLADFGMTPRKKAVVTPATRVAAAAKAKETRALLGTRGSKQKKQARAQAAEAAEKPAAATTAPTAPATPAAPGTPAPAKS